KSIEVSKSPGRIGGFGEEARGLLDHLHGGSKPPLLPHVFNLFSPAIRDEKLIECPPAGAADLYAVYIDAAHSQGIGDRVKKTERVVGANFQEGPLRGSLIVEVQFHR